MATINPFQGPINYSVDVQSPFEAALGGVKLGAGIAEIQAAQQKRELESKALAQAQAAQTELKTLFNNPNATSADYARVSAFLPKDQAAIVTQGFEAQTKEQQQNTLKSGAQVYTAIKSGNLPVAEMQLKEQAEALRNAGKEKEAQGYDDLSNLIRLNPTGAQTTIALTIAGLPGGKEFLENADKALATMRAETLAPSALKASVADAEKKTADAAEAALKAADTPARLETEKKLRVAQAEEAEVKAKYAERLALADIKKKSEPSQPLVSLSVGDQRKRDDLALKELDIPRAQEFSAAAASARGFARDARVIANLLKGKGGGAVIKLGSDIAKTFGFETATVTANDLANSLAVRGATQMRAPGSGATSDIEFKSFVSAFPSLANSEGGRELMAKYGELFAKRSAKLADHARQLIRDDKYTEEEMARYDESLGSVLDKDFYESTNTGPRANVPKYVPPAASAAPAAAPRTVDSVLQQYLPKKPK